MSGKITVRLVVPWYAKVWLAMAKFHARMGFPVDPYRVAGQIRRMIRVSIG